jgi:hypothetical protein
VRASKKAERELRKGGERASKRGRELRERERER